MTVLLDANVIVRHLTGDPVTQARRATRCLVAANELIVADLVFAEVIYVLESFYEAPKAAIAEMTRSLLALPSIAVTDHDLLLRAVELYETARLDFAEAYWWRWRSFPTSTRSPCSIARSIE